MEVVFLGTGTSQGVPFIGCKCNVCRSNNPKDKRLRTSVYIQTKNNHIVIDTGPDFRQQMLRAQIPDINCVLFTHGHKDHIAGLDDIKAYNYHNHHAIESFGNQYALQDIRREFYYFFEENKYPGIPDINLTEVNETPFNFNGVTIQPIPVRHMQLPVLGFRIDNFTYITDANYISEASLSLIKDSEYLVLNALRNEPHISHFTLKEAIDIVDEIKPKKAYFTHISHQLGLHEIIEKKLPSGMHLAYDGLTLNI